MKKTLILANLVLIIFSTCLGSAGISRVQAAYGINESFKQVKTADSPVVYYLDHVRGLKKAYVSEKAYLSYGNSWSDVKTISQEELDKWAEMHLVKAANSNQVYYINNGYKALIESEQQFIDYGFDWKDVVTISEIDLNEYAVSSFDSVKAALAGDYDSEQNGLLKVSLASLNLSSLYLPTGSRNNTVAAFKLEAADADIEINQLTFTQQGVSSDEVIDAVYLTDENGVIYGEKNSLNDKRFYLNLNGQPVTISAGSSKTFYLKVDLKPVSGSNGQTLKFGILNPLDITSSAQLSAGFPIIGPEFKLVDGVNNLGAVSATSKILNSSGDKVNIGSTNKTVAAFKLTETSGNEDILVKNITLTNIGSAQDGDLTDLVLIDGSGNKVMKVQSAGGQKVSFNLEPGYLIKKGHYVDFYLKAAVVGGESRDIKFVIDNSSDITAVGRDNGYSLYVVNNSASDSQVNRFTIVRSPIFITTASLKSNESLIYRDEDDAVIGSFELRNNISDIRLASLTIAIVKSSGAPDLDQTLYAVDAKTGAILGTANAKKATGDLIDMNLSSFAVAKGETVKIKIKTHIPYEAQSGGSYVVYIQSVNYRVAENNILYSDKVELAGQEIAVVRPTVYLYGSEIKESDIAVAGDEKVIVGSFVLEATDERDVKVTSLTITNAAGFTSVNYINGFTNLALYKGSSRISGVIAEPNENSYTFEDLKIRVSAGKSVTIYVKADSAVNTEGTVKLFAENAVAEDYSTGILAEVNNKNINGPEVTVTQTILEVNGATGGRAVLGEKNNQIASFTLTNLSAEKIKLSKLTLGSSADFSGNLSNNNGFSNLRFTYIKSNNKTASAGSRVSKPVADINEISLGSLSLAAGESITLNLLVDVASDASTGSLNLYIRDLRAKGYSSGINATIGGVPTETVEASVN